MILLVLKGVYKKMNKKFLLKICFVIGMTMFIATDIMYYGGKFDQTFWEHIIIGGTILVTTINTLFLYWKN